MEIKEGLISSAITVTNKTSLYGLPSGNFYDPSFLLGGMHCFTCSFLLFLFLQSVLAPVFIRGAQKAVLGSVPIRFDNRFGSVGRAQTIAR